MAYTMSTRVDRRLKTVVFYVCFFFIYFLLVRHALYVIASNYCDRPETGRSPYCLLVPTPHFQRKGTRFAGKRHVYSISELRWTHNPLSSKTVPFFCSFSSIRRSIRFQKKKVNVSFSGWPRSQAVPVYCAFVFFFFLITFNGSSTIDVQCLL